MTNDNDWNTLLRVATPFMLVGACFAVIIWVLTVL